MSGNAPVDPAEVPVFTGDLAELDTKVKALSGDGAKVMTAAGDVHSSFGGLSAFYQAPEAEQLFATTRPLTTQAGGISSDMCVIAGALGTYARDVRPLIAKLDSLRQDAVEFRTKVSKDDKWREDGDLIEENLGRRNEIAEVWTQFQEAERQAHATIVALVGGKPLIVNDGSGKENMYGYDAEALKQSKSLPWGDAVEESLRWWEQAWKYTTDFAKGVFVDGVWGTIKGLGTLVGFDGWEAAGQAWTGLAKLATGLVITGIPVVGGLYLTADDDQLPSWLRESRTAMKETGKALVAWDQWGTNPSRAAGAVTFNVLTTVFTGGTGGAVAGAGKAGLAVRAISFAGKAGKVIDPMTYIFKGAGAGLSKIGDVMAGLRGMGAIEIPKISEGAFSLPDGALKLPDGSIRLPEGAGIPEGAVKLPDGSVKLPEGTVTLPPGTVKWPFEDGPAKYADPAGNLYKEDGSLFQRAEDAKVEKPPTAGADKPKVEAPVLAGVGARAGDDAIRLGSDISGPVVHAADKGAHGTGGFDNTPTGRAGEHGTPAGNAGDPPPRNIPDHTPGGATGHPDGTGTGAPHGDGPPSGGGGHIDGPEVPGHGHSDSSPPHGTDGHADHHENGSASTPAESISPEVQLPDPDGKIPAGHGEKLLDLVDVNSPRVTVVDGVITHIDGQPVSNYLDDLAKERAQVYRDAKDAKQFVKGDVGACVGAVMDTRTGVVIEGINGRPNNVITEERLHPTLRELYEKVAPNKPHPDEPLGHAEVKATNELLWARTRLGLPAGADALKEISAAVEFPFLKNKQTGMPGFGAPFCANCYNMLPGMPTKNGRFTGYPPSDENWIP